jgi:hypothetical protein
MHFMLIARSAFLYFYPIHLTLFAMKRTVLFLITALSLPFQDVLCREITGLKPRKKDLMPLAAGCAAPSAMTDIDIGNVRATILAGSDMWWDMAGVPGYEVPKGSGKHSLFASSIWIGGIDAGKNLKTAAQTYRQQGAVDWWTGPLDGQGEISAQECQKYDRIYRITRAEVQNFIASGVRTPAIDNWPGNGDISIGQAQNLAPYVDVDGDGFYSPSAGDYPGYNFSLTNANCNNQLYGDQTLWWVFNDKGNIHTSSQSTLSLGVEVRAQAFAYASPDPHISNTTFYKYQIINRSSTTLDSTYIGMWVDSDLGKFNDDYIGCDVGRSLGYGYNGDNNDDGPIGYGINPPAVGLDMLQGPLADAGDGIDNDKDGTADEPDEEILMSSFLYFRNDLSPQGNPFNSYDFYNYLRGRWLDGSPMTYGGNGKGVGNGATSTPCRYMFPGTTDPANTTDWTEVTAGNSPGDRRFVQAAGPFTMVPGAVQYVTNAAVWARAASGGATASVDSLKAADDRVQNFFSKCFDVVSVSEHEKDARKVLVSPNPFSSRTELSFANPLGHSHTLRLFNITGKEVQNYENISGTSVVISRGALPAGIYFYRLTDTQASRQLTGKIIIH